MNQVSTPAPIPHFLASVEGFTITQKWLLKNRRFGIRRPAKIPILYYEYVSETNVSLCKMGRREAIFRTMLKIRIDVYE